MPILSVIIVAYRSRDELPGCLASLPTKLNDGAIEVFIVNNSPGDGVLEWTKREFPTISFIEARENLGFGRANNVGYAQCAGDYVLFLNPDTVVNKAGLLHCIERLKGDASIGLISPKLVQADGTMDQACRRSIPTLWDGFCRASGLASFFSKRAIFSSYNLTHLPVDGTYEVGAINGAFMLAPRRMLTEVVPDGKVFDEAFFMYGDDLDLCIRVARAGWKIVYDGSVSIVHLKGLSVARDFDRMSRAIFDANRDVYLKHFNPQNSRWICWKYALAFGAWKRISLMRARLRGHRRVRPV